MRSFKWQKMFGPALFIVASPILVNCGAKLPGPLGDLADAGSCPDSASVDAIAKVDWSQALKVDAKVGAQIKGGLQAAVNLQALATQIDADLKGACAGLATDLGAGGEFADAKAACEAAISGITKIRAEIGGEIAINIEPPKCGADLQATADCAGKCDASVKPGKLEAMCEPGKLSGECSANCEGSCDASGGIKCSGECSGKCDAEISGKCEGECDGKCNGKKSKGSCDGKCDGKCSGNVKAECKGKCDGGCQLKAGAKCEGTCTGKCSAEFKAPKCTAEVKPPEMSAECKASCDAEVSAKLSCTPVKVIVSAPKGNAAAVAKFEMALKKNLPNILKVSIGLKDRAPKIVAGAEAVFKGVESAATASVSGGPTVAAKIGLCVGKPFKGAIEAAAGISANVNVSVSVSAKASGKAGT